MYSVNILFKEYFVIYFIALLVKLIVLYFHPLIFVLFKGQFVLRVIFRAMRCVIIFKFNF